MGKPGILKANGSGRNDGISTNRKNVVKNIAGGTQWAWVFDAIAIGLMNKDE